MCGLAGQCGRIDLNVLGQMGETIKHRGPDGDGMWVAPGGRTAFAHRRLAIIDLSPTGAQPMVDEERGGALVFNGEIYNHRLLRQRLSRTGPFRGTSDTETLLRLLATEGFDALDEVRGIYAFAYADLATGRTYLVRDRYGVKPLYYYQTPERVSFASELKALLMDPQVDRKLDRASCMRSVAYLWTPSPSTVLAGCRKVGPGEVLELRDGRVGPVVATLDRSVAGLGPARSQPEFEEAVRSALTTAVERQMESDVPVGAFLSGGVDSSSVVREAARVGEVACTFTVADSAVTSEGFADDLPFARVAAEAFGVANRLLEAPRLTGANLSELTWIADEIHADPAVLLAAAVARHAGEQGIKVLLGGVAADDVFTGYRRHRLASALDQAGRLGPLAAGAASMVSGLMPARPPALRRVGKVLGSLERDPVSQVIGLFRWISVDWICRLFDVGALEARETLEAPFREELERCPWSGLLPQCLWLDQRFFLADHNLDYVDKAAMAHGVEVRVPYLDEDLTALAAANHGRLMGRRWSAKAGLRSAVAPNLPAAILDRPKVGFGTALRARFDNDLGGAADDLLSAKSLDNRGLFDDAATDALLAQNASGRVDASYPLLSMMLVESWSRTFMDRRDVTTPSDEQWPVSHDM